VKSLPPAPAREEWHFDGVPEPQRWACYYYEYSRSHNALRESIVGIRRGLSLSTQQEINELAANLVRLRLHSTDDGKRSKEIFSLIAGISPEFPETPWQMIPAAVRRDRMRQIPDVERDIYRPVKEHELYRIARGPSSDRVEDYISLEEAPREFGVVQLDWSLSDEALRKRFNHFLKHRSHPPLKTGGRGHSPIDGLHALGAWRLKGHYGSPAKVMAAMTQGLVALEYSDERALRTAVKRAASILATF
jgi:hypothetical protein